MTVARPEYLTTLQEILSLDINTCMVEVCIAALDDNESLPEFRRLRLAESLKEEFRYLIQTAMFDYRKQLKLRNLQLQEFDVASKPASYQIEHVDLAKKPYDNIVEQTQPLTMLHGLDTFKEEILFIEKMRFYVMILQPPQGQAVYFYRRYSQKKMLHEAAPLSIQRMLGHTDEFEDVKTPIFLFDKSIDCISRGNDLFILAKSHFYYMFRILDELIESSKDILDRIHDRIPIENFGLFSRSCTNNKIKMGKLTSIARRPYLGSLTIADLKRVIRKNNLHIPVISANGQEMLHFDRDYPWDILKLLDDDYLTSIMTGQDYEVDAKRDT
jgi:Kiwa KwaB-like protein